MQGPRITTKTFGLGVEWPLDEHGRPATVSLPDGRRLRLVLVDRAGDGFDGTTVAVTESRALTALDDGKILDCTAAGVTLTIPRTLPRNFGCLVIPNGTTSFASSGGVLLNSATTTIARSSSSNATVAVVARSAPNSYVITGT